MGDNRDKDKEASKTLNSDADSDILKQIDLAFQVKDKSQDINTIIRKNDKAARQSF